MEFIIFSILCLINLATQAKGSDAVFKNFEIISENCKFQEPIYNQTFDLNPLKSDLGHSFHSVDPVDDLISFNVCGKLNRPCANQTNVNACIKKPDGREIVVGFNESLYLTDGRFHFSFNGQQCNGTHNYSMNVILNCDYDSIEQPFTIFPYKNDMCMFFVMWTTELACYKLPKAVEHNKCSVRDNDGHVFDLMALSHENKKIKVDNPGKNEPSEFLINICKPTLYKHMEMCPPGSSVCLVNAMEKNLKDRFVSGGNVVANPVLDAEGQLVMKFPSTTKCSQTENLTSTIYFTCDELNEFGEPEFLRREKCELIFSWGTSLACKKHSFCETIDPTTGFKFDMSPLASKSFNLTRDDKNYFFSVCSKMLEPCAGDSAACSITVSQQSTSLGVSNDYLRYNVTGAPYLLYENGAKCDATRRWSTKIEFLCASKGLAEGPHIIEHKDCQLLVHFVTENACQTNMTCKVESYSAGNDDNGIVVDLTRLIRTNENYVATVNDTLLQQKGWDKSVQFYINVCRPLVSKFGLNCVGGSAACKATRDNHTQTAEEEQSMGFPDVSLTLVDTDHGKRAQLKYLRGSPCTADPSTSLSTQIEFYCKQSAGLGNPVLQEVKHECHYQFDWATNIICPSFRSKVNNQDCVIHNEEINRSLNLRDMFAGEKLSVKGDKKGQTSIFDFNICENNRNVTINYKESTVQIFMKPLGKCGNDDTFDVEIRLVCYKTHQGYSEREGSSCRMLYTQETPLVCPLLGIKMNDTNPNTDKQVAPANDQQKVNVPYIMGVFAIVLLLSTVVLSGLFVLKDGHRRQRIINIFRRRGPSVQYSRVRSNEEASLLLENPMSLSDSDDDLLI